MGAPIVPPVLVPAVRAYFSSRGITPSAVSDNGEIDPQAFLALVYAGVEIRSRLFEDPLFYDFRNTAPNPKTQAALRFAQPAVLLRRVDGGYDTLLAPYGLPTDVAPQVRSAGSSIGIGIGAGVLGLLLVGAIVFRH